MAKTLAQYNALIKNEVDDTSNRASAIIDEAIQETYQEVLNFTADKFIGTTEEDVAVIIGQRFITPVNEFQTIKKVLFKRQDDSIFNNLDDQFTEEDYYSFWINSTASDPTKYYVNANKIFFNVTPQNNGTIKVCGIKATPALSGNTLSVIPHRFDSVIILGAIARFKAYEGVNDALEYFSMYRGPQFDQGKIGGALENMLDKLDTKSPSIRPKFYGIR